MVGRRAAPGQLTLLGQREARDAAIEAVTDAPWEAFALRAISMLAYGEPFIASDVWRILDEWAIPRPREPRAMGAAMRYAIRHHWIAPTGRNRPARDPVNRNHLRPEAEYVGR